MPDVTMADLRTIRVWWRWLLITVAAVQGGQYMLHPELAYNSPSYAAMRPLGLQGWVVFGAVLILLAGYLTAVPARLRWTGHFAGAVLYLLLMAAAIMSGAVPAVLALPAGLHLGEVRLRAWHRRRDG